MGDGWVLWQEVEASRIGRLKVPPQYKEKFMTAIGTDPMSTTLKRTPYYFPIGLQLSLPKPLCVPLPSSTRRLKLILTHRTRTRARHTHTHTHTRGCEQ
jgi:hypothetical protein